MPLIVAALGCQTVATVGEGCPAVEINEVMSANTTYTVPQVGTTSDWFELHNFGEGTVDLEGYLLIGHSEEEPAYEVPEGQTLSEDGYQLFVAATYNNDRSPVPVTLFDLNDDSDGMTFWAPTDAGYTRCDAVSIPDQHQNFSWQRAPTDPDSWCDASHPTPGKPNEPCLCASTEAC